MIDPPNGYCVFNRFWLIVVTCSCDVRVSSLADLGEHCSLNDVRQCPCRTPGKKSGLGFVQAPPECSDQELV